MDEQGQKKTQDEKRANENVEIELARVKQARFPTLR